MDKVKEDDGMKKTNRIVLMISMLMMAVILWKALPVSAAEIWTPTALDDSNSEAGFISTWDCIWFGNYPQSEVTSGDNVYQALVNAKNSQWSNNTIWINGSKYLRMRGKDSLYNSEQIAASASSLSGFYPYKGDGQTYHYFKFEPIKWRVLEINDDNIVVVSDKILDASYWHVNHSAHAKWYNSTIRSWLNGYNGRYNLSEKDYGSNNFIDMAFSAEEKAVLKMTVVTMENHPDGYDESYGDGVGDLDTLDYVYLLAQRDIQRTDGNASNYGFRTSNNQYDVDENRYCKATTYANARGVAVSTDSKTSGNANWWLRSPAKSRIDAQVSNESGWIFEPNMDSLGGVRPVITIPRNHYLYCYAGTVNWRKTSETAPSFSNKSQCNHVMKKTEAKPATTKSNGNVEYYTCLGCNKIFNDEAGSKQYAKSQTVIYKITSVEPSTSVYYYNKSKTRNPGVVIKDSKGNKLSSSDYTLTRNKKTAVGKYELKVVFKGNYSGSTSVTYEIRPLSASVKKLTKGKKSFTLTWSKQKTQTTGYQIGYTTDKKFKSLSYKTVTDLDTTKKTISGLKSKKKYYVAIRTYKTVKYKGESIKIYSAWTTPKTITTK